MLARCLAGDAPAKLPRELLDDSAAASLFGILAEGLADRFEPELEDVYAQLFSQAVAHVTEHRASELVARYRRVRQPRAVPPDAAPATVFVLSRITLGADIAVTSVVMDAAKRRFREARIVFVGPRKNYELFAGDERIKHAHVDYPRGSLKERLGIRRRLATLLNQPGCIALDPDSRLTQLGLLPVCEDDCYFFFDSRSYRSESNLSLPELTSQWGGETLGESGQSFWQANESISPLEGRYIAVSLGVGQNPSKRLPGPFEERLLALLASTGRTLFLDKGAGGAEADRVEAAARAAGIEAAVWNGSFAGFAEIIAGSSLYVGYDSAGQHVASARAVPAITVFCGAPNDRFFARWSPPAPTSHVIRADQASADRVLQEIHARL